MFALEAKDASSMLLDELASLTLVHHAASPFRAHDGVRAAVELWILGVGFLKRRAATSQRECGHSAVDSW